MKYMFPNTSNTNTDEWLLKFDTLFQFIHYWLSSGRSKTPFHCSLTQTVHNLSRSRQLVDIMNRMNLAISYDSMKRINTSVAQKMVEDTLPNRCPVSPKISEWHVVQGAMDNFDHTENTDSGKDSSHDTVLVIFQNQPRDSNSEDIQVTSCSEQLGKRKLADVLPCQVIEKSHLVKGTGDISESFSTTPYYDNRKHSTDDDYFLSCMARQKYTDRKEGSFPSFTATMSAVQNQLKFVPGIYRCFIDGGWVMYHTLRQGSAVGFDMALEKCCNKPAKVAGGIIGMTRQKEAVALWNLLKHEKDLHVAQLLEWCNLGDKDDSELSLQIGHERAKALLDYINSINNPFSTGIRLHNISTRTDIPQEVVGGLLECLEIGENSYQEFVGTRFQNKEKHLHDTIPTNRNTVFVKHPSTSSTLKKSMAKKDAAESIRYIDYARERGYSMLELLKYELTSTSQFLTTECEDGIRLKKPDKASLSRELVNQLPQEKRNIKCDAQMTIVDFMALVRKLPIKKMGIDTFGELAESLCNSILTTGSESTRIDIIFDVYQKSSIKQMERAQRSSSEQITITIRSDNQKVPVDLDMFWSSMLNKVRLQEYVFKWMLQNVVSEKEIIFGGVNGGECRKLLAGIESEITELSSNQEEADDRIMFHINDIVVKHGVQSVLVDSPDTDVFVNLIFHFHKTWQLQKLFVKLGKRKNKKAVPVHLLVDQLDNNLVSCLPAIHALSGCDSTSKVGPKLSGMKASMDLSLLEGFGVEELSPQMISNAEKFLVSGLKKTDCSTFDEYRWEQYHNAKKELDFNQLVCCSSTLGEHIKRAYLQSC